ncbi:MAG: methionyl-tRNA formyltransferase [Bacteroidetes bacterium]|nr:MAG: methionyl-tRNA formyltransferase [Bacteroidota bacterium]
MGTPDFAVASLKALLEAGANIVGVVTAPDKPSGRGMKLNESAVKKFALENHLQILQPLKLKHPEFVNALRALRPDIGVVVAFRMLPEIVWNLSPMGTINLHGSLLPQYRGAAPINWAVINGEKETGVTTFKLQQEIDTGNILMQEKFPIGEKETAGDVHDRMKEIGASLLVKTIIGVAGGTLQEIPQKTLSDPGNIKHAPKINTETCRINWEKSAEEVYNLIRGLSPFPTAFTQLNSKSLKIFFGEKDYSSKPSASGVHETNGKSYLRFACTDGWLQLKEIQLEGKKKMGIEEFLRGFRS